MTMDEYIKMNKATEILGLKCCYENMRDRLVREKERGRESEFRVVFPAHGEEKETCFTTNPTAEIGEMIITKAIEIMNREIAEQEKKFTEL